MYPAVAITGVTKVDIPEAKQGNHLFLLINIYMLTKVDTSTIVVRFFMPEWVFLNRKTVNRKRFQQSDQ